MSRTRLVLIPAEGTDPAPFLMLDAEGRVLERGHLSPDSPPVPVTRVRTVAIVPGADVLIRWLTLPAGRPVQQRGGCPLGPARGSRGRRGHDARRAR